MVVDVTAYLSQPVQCSGSVCVKLDDYDQSHSDLADVNAKVLLWSPKVAHVTAGKTYDPRGKDWVSVSG